MVAIDAPRAGDTTYSSGVAGRRRRGPVQIVTDPERNATVIPGRPSRASRGQPEAVRARPASGDPAEPIAGVSVSTHTHRTSRSASWRRTADPSVGVERLQQPVGVRDPGQAERVMLTIWTAPT
jgi:hypothetical protein